MRRQTTVQRKVHETAIQHLETTNQYEPIYPISRWGIHSQKLEFCRPKGLGERIFRYLSTLSFFKCNWVFVGNLQGQRCTESATMSKNNAQIIKNLPMPYAHMGLSGVSSSWGTPLWMVFLMEKPWKSKVDDDWGSLYFRVSPRN